MLAGPSHSAAESFLPSGLAIPAEPSAVRGQGPKFPEVPSRWAGSGLGELTWLPQSIGGFLSLSSSVRFQQKLLKVDVYRSLFLKTFKILGIEIFSFLLLKSLKHLKNKTFVMKKFDHAQK